LAAEARKPLDDLFDYLGRLSLDSSSSDDEFIEDESDDEFIEDENDEPEGDY
jgi:hypothetical protein